VSENVETREKMTTIRKRIAERLVSAQQEAAILTTFNEIDMTAAMELRAKYKDMFKEKYSLSLGFMGLFVKAAVEALKQFPLVNAYIDGTDILYHNYMNVGIAVSTPKGLMVPVIKNAESLTVAEIEQSIRHYALKARDGKISIDDLADGTFTISNGGVFGSLMSTPILNPPQSAILGMHKIEDRPIAVNGEVVIRPMMYVALSYDHRIIDGKESVSFLVKIKEGIEDPARLLLEI
jgi:2-oxoglutarate dehydrogenase E2 component (dihydrolipoamide succinyltransferase)